jgi:hypothetical protein
MVNLTWDSALASVAAAYAARCTGEHNPDRTTQYGDGSISVGENWYGSYSVPADSTLRPADAINWFAAEKQFYNYDTNACQSGEVCGHYTQVAWATTTKVGCGAAYCPTVPGWTGASNVVVQYCNYAPAGNNGNRPYLPASTGPAPTGSSNPAPTGSSNPAPIGSSGNAPTRSASPAPVAKSGAPVAAQAPSVKAPAATSAPVTGGSNQRSASSSVAPAIVLTATTLITLALYF